MVQNGSSNVRNESAYKMETFELSCTRLPHDRTAGRVKYFLQKDNRVMFIIAKNREDNEFSCSHHVSPKPCSNDSFSMNETYVSFKLRNITLQDAGRYVCLKYSPGLYNLTSEEIDLNVLERPTAEISNDETLTPGANSSYSGKPNSTQATTVTTSTVSKGTDHTNYLFIIGVLIAIIRIGVISYYCYHSCYKGKNSEITRTAEQMVSLN